MGDIKETIKNNAYLNSCDCPVCGKHISRGYEERTFFCERCGTHLKSIHWKRSGSNHF